MSSKYLVTTTGLGTVVKGIEAKCRKRLVASSPLPERRRQRMQEVKVESSVIKDDEAGARLRIEWTDEIYELPLPPAADNSERGQHIWALEGPRLGVVFGEVVPV